MADHPHPVPKRRNETPYVMRKRLEHEAMRDMYPHHSSPRVPTKRVHRKKLV